MTQVKITRGPLFPEDSFGMVVNWYRLKINRVEEICRGTVYDQSFAKIIEHLKYLHDNPPARATYFAGMTASGLIFQDVQIDWKASRIVKRNGQDVALLKTKGLTDRILVWAGKSVLAQGFEITESEFRIVVCLIVAVEV
ncbi:hypothetical protein HN858_03770 [Candidatus Falkowbacteria bacterium]|jgi:hypothetical protein|nr:hypothetical protein [Candidatus Falkowbacteria bacterium]MBT5503716.1 hypothetical protein [Candidatus Falkowbacteria bacterium]MBT6573804.1 hypothetical protein [Candidatus Falkowbacteria bacterium]MBT7348768.1 hypothetical protein [Candidatus Falkowbacteria bacterium]MBT7500558.1 hypothetical protein [Candidatus Falkowbacteria bacterium]